MWLCGAQSFCIGRRINTNHLLNMSVQIYILCKFCQPLGVSKHITLRLGGTLPEVCPAFLWKIADIFPLSLCKEKNSHQIISPFLSPWTSSRNHPLWNCGGAVQEVPDNRRASFWGSSGTFFGIVGHLFCDYQATFFNLALIFWP